MKTILSIALLLWSFSSTANQCETPVKGTSACAHINWDHGQPTLDTPSPFTISFSDENGELTDLPVEISDVEVFMVMGRMAHPGARLDWSHANGSIHSSNARFSLGRMRGCWFVRVHVKATSSLPSSVIWFDAKFDHPNVTCDLSTIDPGQYENNGSGHGHH